MIRDDISDQLIHLTKATNESSAAEVFLRIISEGKLRGGTGYIRGSHTCVCFTEAPIGKLVQVLAEPSVHKEVKYEPFGVMGSKRWIYSQGGRPVIYQPDKEYELLHASQKFRHVRFELEDSFEVDHSWEREWRIHTDQLILDPEKVALVVPTRKWKSWFLDSVQKENGDLDVQASWHFVVLEDLGVCVQCAAPPVGNAV